MDRVASTDNFLFESFRFDRRTGMLFRLDQAGIASPVPLGGRTLELLALLLGRQGELVSKDEIMSIVWPGRVVEEANLNVQISKLRRILDRDRLQGSCIQTVTGHGYRFTTEISTAEAQATSEPCPPSEGSADTNAAHSGVSCVPHSCCEVDTIPLPRGFRMPHGFRGGLIASLIGGLGLIALVAGAVELRSPFVGAENFKPPRLSIVVLPFANIGSDQEPQYFAEGVTEDLTTDLSRNCS